MTIRSHAWPLARPILMVSTVLLTLSACVAPPRYHREIVSEPAQPMESTEIVFYPANGQSAAQQDRDRYDCYQWAVAQAHFDPNQASLAQQHVRVTPETPEGQNTVAGVVTGAVLGAVVARPRDAGIGAVLGAMTGAVVGASADAAQTQQTERIQQRYDAREAQQSALLNGQINNYRRAMSACLEGRGYTVK